MVAPTNIKTMGETVSAMYFNHTGRVYMLKGSSDGIATGCELEGPVQYLSGTRGFLCSTASRPAVAHPNSYPMGTGTLSLGINWQRREVDHPHPSGTEVKYAGPIQRLHGVVTVTTVPFYVCLSVYLNYLSLSQYILWHDVRKSFIILCADRPC
jgi:hypothetical protein